MEYIQIQWTSDSLDEAKEISKTLVKKRWVAIANILPYVDSFYLFNGKLKEDREVKVFFKTRDEFYNKVQDYIIQHATYDVPDISKIPITDANPDYISWLSDQLTEDEE